MPTNAMDGSQNKPGATTVESASHNGDKASVDVIGPAHGDRALEIIGNQRVVLTEEDVRLSNPNRRNRVLEGPSR